MFHHLFQNRTFDDKWHSFLRAYCTYEWWCRCQDDSIGSLTRKLEETTRASSYNVAEHRPARSESLDLAQNRPLCRLMSTYGAMHSYWCMQGKKKMPVLSPTSGTNLTSRLDSSFLHPPSDSWWKGHCSLYGRSQTPVPKVCRLFAPWTFCPMYGRFAPWVICPTLDISPHKQFIHRRFAPWTWGKTSMDSSPLLHGAKRLWRWGEPSMGELPIWQNV